MDFEREFRGRSRFLIDHNLPPELASILNRRGFNVKTAKDLNVDRRADEDVLAFAKRERRILLTSDRDFLNEHQFPPHRNPGIVVLPAASSEYRALVTAVFTILPLVGKYPVLWHGSI